MKVVICDHCGKVLKEQDALKFVMVINLDGCLYGAHLCNRCLNKYDIYPGANHWGECARLKEKKRKKGWE